MYMYMYDIVGGPNFVPDLISSSCLFLMKSREIFVDFQPKLLVKLNLHGWVIFFSGKHGH